MMVASTQSSQMRLSESIQSKLVKRFEDRIHLKESMKSWTTFRCTGAASILALPQNLEELREMIRTFGSHGLKMGRDWQMLGRGSNLLVQDGGYLGVLVSLAKGLTAKEVLEEDRESIRLRIEAGVSNQVLVQWLCEEGLEGFAFVSGIPGSIGGGIRMNAGTSQGLFSNVLTHVELTDLNGETKSHAVKEKDFTCRDFLLPKGMVITAGYFRFLRASPEKVKQQIKAAKKLRADQPWDKPSFGSIFKNPKGAHAGQLIDEAGLKGLRIGDAEISKQHANFMVNLGHAKTSEALQLMKEVSKKVRERFGVDLEPEVHVIGVPG